MKKLFLMILLLIYATDKNAVQPQYKSNPDSLREIIQSTPRNDTTRLSAMKELARIEQNTEDGLKLTIELLDEARRLEIERYIAFGAYYALIYHYNRQEIDSIKYYTDIVLPSAEKDQLWIVYFEALKLRATAYILEENFELAINEGLKMLQKARDINYPEGIMSANTTLGIAYMSTDRWHEGLQFLREAHKYMSQANNILASNNVLGMLIAASFQEKDYSALYQYLDEFEKNLTEYLKTAPFNESLYGHYAYIEIYTAYYHLRTGKPDEALPHLTKAEGFLEKSGFIMYILLYRDALIEYYQLNKEYDKALDQIDTTLVILKEISMGDYYSQLVKKANLYIETGEYTKSLPLFKEAIAGNDSLTQAISNKQMEQIQQIYNINRLRYEQEQLKSKKHSIVLLLIILGIIILSIFITRIIFVKRRLKKSESQIRKASITANEANKTKERFLSNMSYNIRTPLNSVVGFSQLLSAEPDMDEEIRKEYAAIIRKNSEELMSLVNSILDLSRLEAGMMKFNISRCSIASICNDAIYMSNNRNKDLIHIHIDTTIPQSEIETDCSRFIFMLSSLLTYPVMCDEKREITLHINKDISGNEIIVEIINTPLADPSFTTQEIAIRNEINRLFIAHFGGIYRINSANSLLPGIVFTYPLSIS